MKKKSDFKYYDEKEIRDFIKKVNFYLTEYSWFGDVIKRLAEQYPYVLQEILTDEEKEKIKKGNYPKWN